MVVLFSSWLALELSKMSKSSKNFITFEQALKKYDFRQLRLLCLSHSWSFTLNYSDHEMNKAVIYEVMLNDSFFHDVKTHLGVFQVSSNANAVTKFDEHGRTFNEHFSTRAQCFSGDSLIKLSNGEYKEIGNLQSSDEIITIDQSKTISTEMIMMLDKQISKQALFYTLRTDSGNEISLTEYHLIPTINSNGNENYLFAKQIKIGDYLFVLFNGKLKYSPVINITIEMKKGYYAPLTMKGTLLINNVLASCFANVNNHHLAQYYMTPFHYYYKFARFMSLYDPFNINKTEGLHWTVNIMLYFARYFRLDALCL
ncbi:unnamed protein product [Rotaria sp. Silwood1]|nr:unnamed protein product [Rotaria sp. Silwood1]CAF4893527.1 unnamed protein product [Rotaria sp. Silwood1]CAF4927464.1 unnamed protein product [Rotaria sp. Silwood1]CAF4954888.1 unnamed protein product [Rotaria sp. Silwood1]CAF4980560.1 unnamed protein product [Rotaria sp. Silwood1]